MVFARAAALAIAAAPCRTARRARLGRQPRDRRRRVRRHLAQLGRAAPLHVGLRRHRAHQQAPGARRAPHCPAARARSRSSTRTSTSRAILLELRNLVQVADLIVKAHSCAAKAGPALQPRLPGSGSACCAHHSGATGAALRHQPGPLRRSPEKRQGTEGNSGADGLRRRPPCLPQRRGACGLARLAQKALPCCPAPPCSPLPRSSSSPGMTAGGSAIC